MGENILNDLNIHDNRISYCIDHFDEDSSVVRIVRKNKKNITLIFLINSWNQNFLFMNDKIIVERAIKNKTKIKLDNNDDSFLIDCGVDSSWFHIRKHIILVETKPRFDIMKELLAI